MEIIQNLNAFARFHSKEEHEQFVEGMILEYRLRRKIEKLQHHRLVGIRTLVDSEIYDAEKSMGPSRRSKHAASRRNGGASDSESTLETPAKRKQNQSQAFDVTKLEGYKKLSEAEARLCEMARITPLQYFELRKHIVTEAVARGLLDLESDNHVLKIGMLFLPRLSYTL
jgi:transcriptional adapter 2-alpha